MNYILVYLIIFFIINLYLYKKIKVNIQTVFLNNKLDTSYPIFYTMLFGTYKNKKNKKTLGGKLLEISKNYI